jgi:hypothetical protein
MLILLVISIFDSYSIFFQPKQHAGKKTVPSDLDKQTAGTAKSRASKSSRA